jgi:hypothetical protein
VDKRMLKVASFWAVGASAATALVGLMAGGFGQVPWFSAIASAGLTAGLLAHLFLNVLAFERRFEEEVTATAFAAFIYADLAAFAVFFTVRHATDDPNAAILAGTIATAAFTAVFEANFARRTRVLERSKTDVKETVVEAVAPVRDEVAELLEAYQRNLGAMRTKEADNRRVIQMLLGIARTLAVRQDDEAHVQLREIVGQLAANGMSIEEIDALWEQHPSSAN